MNEQHKYRSTDKMSDLICDNYSLLMVMSRFGLSLGFGDKSVKDVCEAQGVDCPTFLAVANFISEEQYSYSGNESDFSIPALMDYLKRAHTYFLDFNLPAIRRKLIEAIDCSSTNDVAYLILKFFDEYAKEVRRHMEYENQAVFTYVEQLLQGNLSDEYNIATFASKHNQIDTKLKELKNIKIENGGITFDFISPIENVTGVELGQPVPINITNGVAAMAMAQLNGCTADELRNGMKTYGGVDRRFDFKIKNNKLVFLSDYAHHPKEIYQSAKSIRELYKDRKITAIFQPHLYTRTRDFYKDFANSLSLLDEVILCDIYPAREQPIPGVTSKLIYDNLKPGVEKSIIHKEDVLDLVKNRDFDVLVILGAGDLDNYVPQITKILEEK